MNAKPILFILSFFLLSSFASFGTSIDAPVTEDKKALNEETLKAKIDVLTERVEILKEAKKQAVSKQEKRQIRHEIRDIKKEAKALKQQVSGGIYIGTGVLIVALLLILLL
jgi:hypothetical protein